MAILNTFLPAFALLSLTYAQSSPAPSATVTDMLLVPDNGPNNDTTSAFNVGASVIAANPTATTYRVDCVATTTACEWAHEGGFVTKVAPNVWGGSIDSMPAFYYAWNCTLGVSEMVCAESAAGSDANFPGSSTETYQNASPLVKVQVTAGVDKLSAVSATTTSASSGAYKTATSTTSANAGNIIAPQLMALSMVAACIAVLV